jgi:hypothetical protein
MKRKDQRFGWAAAALVSLAVAAPGAALAQSMTITPAKGQTPQQVELDKSECTTIAQQSAASSAPAPAQPERGGRLRGAAAGAAVGAAGANRRGGEAYDRAGDRAQDEYRENQARTGAAAGMVAGGVAQRRDNRQAAANQQAAGQQATDSAFRSCLMSRGYNVQ